MSSTCASNQSIPDPVRNMFTSEDEYDGGKTVIVISESLSEPKSEFLRVEVWIVVGVVAFIILAVLCTAFVCCVKRRRERRALESESVLPRPYYKTKNPFINRMEAEIRQERSRERIS